MDAGRIPNDRINFGGERVSRGFYGVAMYQPKNTHNWGSLVRSANILGADFIATIGPRYKPQISDVLKSHRHLPVFQFSSFEEFQNSRPYDCQLVAVEMGDESKDLSEFKHPERAIYLLGSEDNGLPPSVLKKCQHVVKLKGDRSMNVSVAGSIVIYHRIGLTP